MSAPLPIPGWSALRGGLRLLQWPLAAVALLFCFRGEGKASAWMAAAFAVPSLRLVLDPDFRHRLRQGLAALWASARAYAQHGGALPWRAALVLVVLPAALLLLSNGRTIGWGDSWPVVPTAGSLVTEGNWEISEFVGAVPASYRVADWGGQPYCVTQTSGSVYSSYPAGMVVFAAPVALAARLTGADLTRPRVQERLEKWTAAWVAACCLGLFFLVALHLDGPSAAAVTTFLLAVGSVVFSTVGQALWQHGGVIFWSLVVLLVEFRSGGRPSLAGGVLQGAGCSLMVACRLSAALFVIPFGLWVLARSPRRAAVVGASAALAYLPWAMLYDSIYGTPFGPSAGQMAGANWAWTSEAFLGVLVSPARGLLVYQPWLILGALTFLPLGWLRPAGQADGPAPRGWHWFCLTVIGLQVGLVAGWCCWWGGHCWGSRLLAEVVPLGALLCVRPIGMLCRRRAGRVVLAGLALTAFLIHAVGVYWEPCWEVRVGLDRNPEVLWSWSRPPFLILWQRTP
ncbi:MAG: hypothetical protein L0Z62_17715 [Gemmataceae bacterium]|nr:hypothetical protein [Gemmataceae bacterium]